MNNQFTDSVTEALQAAFAEAQRRNQTEVTENHLLWAFLQDPQGYFNSILTNLGTNPQTLLREVEHNLEHLPTFSGTSAQPPNACTHSSKPDRRCPKHCAKMERFLHQQRPFFSFLLEKWRRAFCCLEKTNSAFTKTS